jgi:hypothetical protein
MERSCGRLVILDEESPRARLLAVAAFLQARDDREPWWVMYPLKEVLLLVTQTIASW